MIKEQTLDHDSTIVKFEKKLIEPFYDMKYVSLYYNLDVLGKLYVNLWNHNLCKLVLGHVFVNCAYFYSHKLC